VATGVAATRLGSIFPLDPGLTPRANFIAAAGAASWIVFSDCLFHRETPIPVATQSLVGLRRMCGKRCRRSAARVNSSTRPGAHEAVTKPCVAALRLAFFPTPTGVLRPRLTSSRC